MAGRSSFWEEYGWSSWRMYAGPGPAASWLCRDRLQGGCGGRSLKEQRRSLRNDTEAPIRQGKLGSPWGDLVGGVILGEEEEAQKILKDLKSNPAEQTSVRQVARESRPAWGDLVSASEGLLGRTWSDMTNRHGDWGRNGLMAVATDRGGEGDPRPELRCRCAGDSAVLEAAASRPGEGGLPEGLDPSNVEFIDLTPLTRTSCYVQRDRRGSG